MQITVAFHFCAAHRLPLHPGPCRNLHGHNYRLLVSVEGGVDPATGMVQDFYQVKSAVQEEVLARVDHTDLNDLLENPTAEHIAVWIWRRLRPVLPRLAEIVLYETDDCSVRYRGEADAAP
jgi:6-pyruvoyltetrahydropterin/6-carboxytetrahydropterin synthase